MGSDRGHVRSQEILHHITEACTRLMFIHEPTVIPHFRTSPPSLEWTLICHERGIYYIVDGCVRPQLYENIMITL